MARWRSREPFFARVGVHVLVALLAAVAESVLVSLWGVGVKLVGSASLSLWDYAKLAFGAAWVAAVVALVVILARSRREAPAKAVPVQAEAPPAAPALVVARDEHGSDKPLLDYIATHDVRHARMIQFSASFAAHAIRQLLAKNATIDLLIQDPEAIDASTEMGRFQRSKIRTFLQSAQVDMPGLHIRLYAEPASVRGVKLDAGFLAMGWYTYRRAPSPKDPATLVPWLYGHSNATLYASLDAPGAGDLAATFDEQFDVLWRHAKPVSRTAPEPR